MASLLTGGIGAAIGGIGSLVGSGKEASAITSAANTQAQAADYAANLSHQATEQVIGNALPFQSTGYGALQTLAAGLQPGGEFNSSPSGTQILDQDPGYAFRLQMGEQAIQRAEAAAGNGDSGNSLTAADQFAQNDASAEYANAYNRFMTTRQSNYSNLESVAGLGENAAVLSGNAAMTGANQQGNYLTQAANATAAGTVGAANVYGSNLSNLTNLLQQGAQQYLNQSSYNSLSNAAGNYQGLGLPGGSGPSYTIPNLDGFVDTSGGFGTANG